MNCFGSCLQEDAHRVDRGVESRRLDVVRPHRAGDVDEQHDRRVLIGRGELQREGARPRPAANTSASRSRTKGIQRTPGAAVARGALASTSRFVNDDRIAGGPRRTRIASRITAGTTSRSAVEYSGEPKLIRAQTHPELDLRAEPGRQRLADGRHSDRRRSRRRSAGRGSRSRGRRRAASPSGTRWRSSSRRSARRRGTRASASWNAARRRGGDSLRRAAAPTRRGRPAEVVSRPPLDEAGDAADDGSKAPAMSCAETARKTSRVRSSCPDAIGAAERPSNVTRISGEVASASTPPTVPPFASGTASEIGRLAVRRERSPTARRPAMQRLISLALGRGGAERPRHSPRQPRGGHGEDGATQGGGSYEPPEPDGGGDRPGEDQERARRPTRRR